MRAFLLCAFATLALAQALAVPTEQEHPLRQRFKRQKGGNSKGQPDPCPRWPGRPRECRQVWSQVRTFGGIRLTAYIALGSPKSTIRPPGGDRDAGRDFATEISTSPEILAKIGERGERLFPVKSKDDMYLFRLDQQSTRKENPNARDTREFANIQIQLNNNSRNKGKIMKGQPTSIAEVQLQFADEYPQQASGLVKMYSQSKVVLHDLARALKLSMDNQSAAFVWYVQG